MEDYQNAEVDYMNGMKYKDIAEKYGKSINTVKSWKKRHNWNKDKDSIDIVTPEKRVHTKTEGVHTKPKGVHTKKFVDEQIELSNSSGLSEREEMFCINYSKYPNQTKAYMKAYNNNNYGTAQTGAWGLMRKPKIIKRIRELKKGAQETALLGVLDVVEELKKQAFTDVADYLEYGPEKVYVWKKDHNGHDTNIPIMDPSTNEQKFFMIDTVHLKNPEETDTTAIKSVKINKEGHVELEMYDKQKALVELLKFINTGDLQRKLMNAQVEKAMKQLGDNDDTEVMVAELFGKMISSVKKERVADADE